VDFCSFEEKLTEGFCSLSLGVATVFEFQGFCMFLWMFQHIFRFLREFLLELLSQTSKPVLSRSGVL
jgi:hypothetical protein